MVQAVASLAGTALIASLWQGFALAATVGLCLRLVPRSTAELRFLLWIAVLGALCVLPLLPHALATGGQMQAVEPGHRLHLDPRWSYAIAAIWLTLSLVRAADLLRHALRLRALGRDATVVGVDDRTRALLQTSRRPVQICTSSQLERPGVIGFFKPRVLIPGWLFRQLTAPELEQIVLHELEHLRRGDDWLNLLQKLSLVLFPLNPALRWTERRLCVERELACDEGVVRRTRSPRVYAACLAKLAERGMEHRGLSLALGFLERRSELGLRVGSILRRPRALSRKGNLALSGVVAVVLLGGSAEMARSPQLVSFAVAPALTVPNVDARTVDARTVDARAINSATSMPILFTDADAAAPRLLHTALPLRSKPAQRKSKVVRLRAVVVAEGAPVERITPNTLASEIPSQPIGTPTLVRYTLVRVDGGWILVQL